MTKDDVLALLEQADAPVSGEQMCKTLGLTRAAVWKAIEALRADGYEIEAATRRAHLQKVRSKSGWRGNFPRKSSSSCPRSTRRTTISKRLPQTARRTGRQSCLSSRRPDADGGAGASCLSRAGCI